MRSNATWPNEMKLLQAQYVRIAAGKFMVNGKMTMGRARSTYFMVLMLAADKRALSVPSSMVRYNVALVITGNK